MDGGGTTKTLSVSKAGTYDVTVTDYDGCVSSDTIKIKSGSIKAGFSIADTSQCLKNNLFNFKETTKYTNDKQAKSNWVFSDSTSKTDSIVSKSFIKPGVYAVKLVSESQLGCMDSISKTVSIYPQTKIDFSINQATQCFNTHSFDFKITKDTGKIMYSWDLGDVQIPNSGDVNGKKYGKEGIYKISLMSETDKNCKDTLTKSITILSSPKADFSWDLACSRTATNFSFTGTRPTEPIVTIVNWNFNNESTSTLENPSKLFGSAGSKKINIVVYSNNGCMDTLTKTMEIKPQSKAGFEAEDVCESDSVVFMNKSQDASSYNWRFGDGQTSNLQYPKHKYQIPSTTTFNVTLVALVIDGCSDSVIKAVTINTNPKSDFTYIANYNKVDFKATQNGHTTYKWILGNGDSATSTNKDYSYTYSISGKYIACLKVINTAACFSKTCQEVLVAVGINDLNKLKGFKLYPNPNRGHFTLEIEDPSKDVSIAIYDALGNLVKKVIKNNSDKYYTIDANLAGGIYNLRIEQNREIRTIRLIIK